MRKPWGQPEGSEKDDLEDESFHIMALEGGEVVAVGRGHFNNAENWQIRYMAVSEKCRNKGVGTTILSKLEQEAGKQGAKKIMLNARENAIKFYKKHGFKVIEQAHTLFGCIKHFKMIKEIG